MEREQREQISVESDRQIATASTSLNLQRTDESSGEAQPVQIKVLSAWREVASLSMKDLMIVLSHLKVPVTGRVTKIDLQYLLCEKLKISATGCAAQDLFAPLERASIPPEVLPFYRRVGSLASVSTSDGKLWTKDLRKCPTGFHFNLIESYLLHSPDKDYDGDSMRSYKALRAYQLFEECLIHNVEFCPSWPDSSGEVIPLCFFRCKCFPSQDTAKQPYRVVVCMDKKTAQPYGGHCRCVSGLGEACSHIAGLLFAIEDFVSRGFPSLPDSPSTTDVLCKWRQPSGCQKVDAKPLSDIPIRKAVSGGRKRKSKWKRDHHLTKYDPRHPHDRSVEVTAVSQLQTEQLSVIVVYSAIVTSWIWQSERDCSNLLFAPAYPNQYWRMIMSSHMLVR